MSADPIGYVGLGNMGGPMAANLARAGNSMVVFDAAGTAPRAPNTATIAGSVAEVAAAAGTVLVCLPDGAIVESVAKEILEAPQRRTEVLVDNSTIGIGAAQRVAAMLAEGGVQYVDAPVSGGVSGAKAATLAVMVATDRATFERLEPIMKGMAKNVIHVGETVGQGQAMKVLNNFLSATAMAATSEAIAFGESQGLDMKIMLDVLNASSGRNTASSDKFPNRVLTGSYDAGFTSTQMNKDLRLFQEGLELSGSAAPVSPCVAHVWRRIESATPGVDIARIYPFVRDKKFADAEED